MAFPQGPGGFRELREADRKLFHLSWYLFVPVVTSYGQKSSWEEFFTEYGIIFTHVPEMFWTLCGVSNRRKKI